MTTDPRHWPAIHAERRRLIGVLESLDLEQWSAPALCTDWDVQHVVAHLTAAASTTTFAWMRSIVTAGFDPAKHNARRLAPFLHPNPDGTLVEFRNRASATIAPTKDGAAWLGEVIVHGQDIARPLGITLEPDPAAVVTVAEFYAARDFAVHSATAAKGLTLTATDSDFRTGSGPAASGTTLDLVMAMAGRPVPDDALTGPGATELHGRRA